MLSKSYGVEYFGYWNNVDQDEDCTEEQWKERESLWDEALKENSIPAISGFSKTILNHYIPFADGIWEIENGSK